MSSVVWCTLHAGNYRSLFLPLFRIAQEEYRATRSAVVFPNVSLLNLDQLGPQVTFITLLQNSRTASTGTAFPRSTLFIHVPKELVVRDGSVVPLLVPFDVVINNEGSNCSHFQAISELLVGVVLTIEGIVIFTEFGYTHEN